MTQLVAITKSVLFWATSVLSPERWTWSWPLRAPVLGGTEGTLQGLFIKKNIYLFFFFQNLRSRDKQPLVEGDQGDLLLLLWEGLGCNPIFLGLQGDSASPICRCSGGVKSTKCFLHISTLNAENQELHGLALVKRKKEIPSEQGWLCL